MSPRVKNEKTALNENTAANIKALSYETGPIAEPLLPKVSRPEGTELQAVITVMKVCIGTGVLGLPYAIQQSGIVTGIVGLGCIAVWNIFMCKSLLQCQTTLVNSGVNLSSDNSIFSALARHALGPSGTRLLDFSLIVTTLGVCVVYQLSSGQLLDSAGLALVSSGWNTPLCTLLSGVVIYPLTLPTSLAFLSKAAVGAMLCLLVGFAVIFYDGASRGAGVPPLTTNMLFNNSLKGISVYFGIIAFSFGIPSMLFPIQTEMRNPEKIQTAVRHGLGGVFLVYALLGVIGRWNWFWGKV
jgi:sodium-coupled neutral amino acid transporter 11